MIGHEKSPFCLIVDSFLLPTETYRLAFHFEEVLLVTNSFDRRTLQGLDPTFIRPVFRVFQHCSSSIRAFVLFPVLSRLVGQISQTSSTIAMLSCLSATPPCSWQKISVGNALYQAQFFCRLGQDYNCPACDLAPLECVLLRSAPAQSRDYRYQSLIWLSGLCQQFL